ncbi:hypothetical protein L195_g062594, partial [Trifolium pratense]
MRTEHHHGATGYSRHVTLKPSPMDQYDA